MALKVGFVCGDRSGPYYHDIGIPVKYFHKYNLLECTPFEHINLDEMLSQDIVFFQRQYAVESLNTILRFQQMGHPTIAHVDDNVWQIQRNSPAYSTYQGDVIARFQEIMSGAAAVTTSTEYLRSLCLKFNPNVHIFRNLVEIDEIASYPTPGRDHPEEIRIGWTATPHHHDDYVVVAKALEDIARRFQQVKIVFMGYMPKEAKESIPEKQLEYYQFIKVDDFYPCMAALDLDIGIAPLTDHPFNWGKTGRKAQEYATLRTPMILSPVMTYDEWVHGDTCLKPYKNKYKGWMESLTQMITNKELRAELVEHAFAQVRADHDINKYISERAQVFIDVFKRVKNDKKE
jgi:glycosyltransferase involved in cell wall biosynthesis